MGETMTSAELRALTASKPKGKGKTSPTAPKSLTAEEKAKQAASRRQVVGYAHRSDVNTTFGVPVYDLRYRVLSQAEADRLEGLFKQIVTEAQPCATNSTTPTPSRS